MDIGDSIQYLSIVATPVVIYSVWKLKKKKGITNRNRNDLSPLMIKLKKQQEILNKRIKGGILS